MVLWWCLYSILFWNVIHGHTTYQSSGPWFNIEMSSYQYRKSHCGDKTVVRSSYLHNGISYTGKMSSLYWIEAQQIIVGIMTSSNVNIFPVTGPLCGEFTGHRWLPRTKVSDAELWCCFDLRLNKRLSKQWCGWWFETPSLAFWRHCDGRKYAGD